MYILQLKKYNKHLYTECFIICILSISLIWDILFQLNTKNKEIIENNEKIVLNNFQLQINFSYSLNYSYNLNEELYLITKRLNKNIFN